MPTLDQPSWLAHAWAELGQHEVAGPQANPRIRTIFTDALHPETTSDEVPWCAAFVGACLHRADIPPSGSLLARSYLTWGEVIDAPCLGAIAVLSRDPDPSSGHVGFWIGETEANVVLLGGNQGDAVTVASFPKSRLLSLRWPSPVAPPTTTHPTTASVEPSQPAPDPAPVAKYRGFDSALAHVLEMEGGYTNDPADPGGPTNQGITLADYAQYRATPIDALSREALIDGLKHISTSGVRAIYLATYWLPSGCPDLPAPLAFFHFDTAVNMGTGTAIRMLQTALGCTVDGAFGPLTQTAAQQATPAAILATYADLRLRRYRSLSTFPRFGRGWLARVDTTLGRARHLIPSTSPGNSTMTSDQPSTADTSAPFPSAPKWWGQSMTIWGAVIAGLSAVIPVLGPALGVDITPDVVHRSADQFQALIQAALGLVGTMMAIKGRLRASQPLARRDVLLKI